MTEDSFDGEEATEEELRAELRQTRSRLRMLESELAETNEGMVALTLELENAKERYQTIFQETTDGIILLDPEGDSIFEVNPQACELLGYDRDRLVKLSPTDIFPDEGDRAQTFAEAAVQGWANSVICRTKEGRKVDVDISASTVTLNGRSLLLVSLRDVTERKRREQRLQVLTRLFRHNFRNDGNVIQGYADSLYGELSDTELEDDVRQIRETIDDILAIGNKVWRIQDVLDRNHVTLISVSELLSPYQKEFEETYPANALNIYTPEEEIMVARRLKVAIQEGIDNAAKHSNSTPTISISVTVDDDRNQVQLEIEDNGPGIPEEEIQALRSGGETQLTHGSGIGLWVIYWVVDSLGGELAIQRGDENGTLLSITVPLVTEQPTPDLWREQSQPSTD